MYNSIENFYSLDPCVDLNESDDLLPAGTVWDTTEN